MVLLNASNRRISKRPICFNLAPPQSRRTRDPDMLSAVGLSDIDCPLWSTSRLKKSRRFYSDHQSTLVAIGIGRHVRVGSKTEVAASRQDVRFAPDTVAKVENQATRKISRKLIFGLLRRCVAFQCHHGGPWSILDETMWSLTSPLAKRISGSKKLRSSPQKDFCNKIPR